MASGGIERVIPRKNVSIIIKWGNKKGKLYVKRETNDVKGLQ